MRSVLVHGALATFGLVAAFYVWTAGDRTVRPAESVTLFACADSTLEAVKLVTKKKTVDVQFGRKDGKKGELASFISVHTPDETTPTNVTVDRFAASDKLDRLAERLLPFSADRSVGTVDDAKLRELGLHTPSDSLAVTCSGETREWVLGNKTYGGRTRYAMAKGGGPVQLLANGLISDLEMSEFRFMQRDLVRVQLRDLEKIEVTAAAGARTLIQLNRLDSVKATWVDAEEPTRRNELYGNWLRKVFKLRALNYLADGTSPGSEKGASMKYEPVAILKLSGDNDEQIELVSVGERGAPDRKFYARSGTTSGWVTVPPSLGQQVADDVPTVLGVEQVEAAQPPKPVTPTGAPQPRGR